jgi:hypothetical protein
MFLSTIVRRCSEVPFCLLQIVIPGSGHVGQIHLSTDDCPEVDLKSGLSQRGRTRRDCSQRRGRLQKGFRTATQTIGSEGYSERESRDVMTGAGVLLNLQGKKVNPQRIERFQETA